MDSDSDSDPVDKPAKSGKKKPKVGKPKREAEPELKEDEEEEKLTGSDGEEKEKYKKVPCNMCGRQMANEFVLQYHLVRCPGRKAAKLMFVMFPKGNELPTKLIVSF